MRRRLGVRMDGRIAIDPSRRPNCVEDRAQRLRAMDHHEAPARAKQRERGDDPARQRRFRPPGLARRRRRHGRWRAARRARREPSKRRKNGGLVTTRIGRAVRQAGRPARARPSLRLAANTTWMRSVKPLSAAFSAARTARPEILLKKVGARARQALDDRQADGPDPPAPTSTRRATPAAGAAAASRDRIAAGPDARGRAAGYVDRPPSKASRLVAEKRGPGRPA